MKKLLKEAIGFLLVKSFILLGRKPDRVLSVTFHRPSLKMMKDVIAWLEKWQFRVVSLAELENFMQEPTPNGRIAFITLDDAWRSNLQLLDLLAEKQVPIAIFVPTEPVETGNYWWEFAANPGQERITGIPSVEAFKKLPEAERVAKLTRLRQSVKLERSCMTLQELRSVAGHPMVTIGSHTVTHPILNRCSNDQQQHEIFESRKTLEKWLGKPVHYFAYPNGDYEKETLDLVKEAGYRIAFTDRAGRVSFPSGNPLEIPRNSLNDDHGYYENYAKMLGVWQRVFGN